MEMVVKELELFKTFEPSKREENISSMKMCAKRVLSNMDVSFFLLINRVAFPFFLVY